jgi:hypothetical protein
MNQVQRQRKTEWQRKSRAAFKATHGFSTTAMYGAGGSRLQVLERDGHACVQCGMTDEAHKKAWGRPITIDHIDKDRSNNSLDNLQTLCLTCHGRKDLIPALRRSLARPLLPRMRELRAAGRTYQEIADTVGLSIGCVWKNMNGEQE